MWSCVVAGAAGVSRGPKLGRRRGPRSRPGLRVIGAGGPPTSPASAAPAAAQPIEAVQTGDRL